MTIEELKQIEFESFLKDSESFKKDFEELINKHREALLLLKMGISINCNASCVHYKGNSYGIDLGLGIDIEPIKEWYN